MLTNDKTLKLLILVKKEETTTNVIQENQQQKTVVILQQRPPAFYTSIKADKLAVTKHEEKDKNHNEVSRKAEIKDEKKICREDYDYRVKRCLNSLDHAPQCHDQNCQLKECYRMKRILKHHSICKRRASGGCVVCKQFVPFCGIHATRCDRESCAMPYCNCFCRKLENGELKVSLKANNKKFCAIRTGKNEKNIKQLRYSGGNSSTEISSEVLSSSSLPVMTIDNVVPLSGVAILISLNDAAKTSK